MASQTKNQDSIKQIFVISGIHTISSGGQTGVDRAALDVAMSLEKNIEGWCPKGRWAEDGPLPAKYPLIETESDQVRDRTEKNIIETNATLVLAFSQNYDKGSLYTIEQCLKHSKPFLEADLSLNPGMQLSIFTEWIAKHKIQYLNVAGPRESSSPGIYRAACKLLYIFLETK